MDTSILIQLGFIAVTLLYFGMLFQEIRKALHRSALSSQQKMKIFSRSLFALIVWIGFVSAWSLNGRMGDFTLFPFNVMPVVLIPLVTLVALTFSKTVTEIIRHIPPQHLIRLQSFRVFVEILLWGLYADHLLPVQMTFEGRNFDILSGLSAVVIAYLISRRKISRTGIIVWNIACFALLVNIVGTAILSMPTPLRIFMNEPANTIVTAFPYSWLPGLLVPLAYGLHFLSLRQMAVNGDQTPLA